MKILLLAPQAKDTVMGMIGNYSRRALEDLDCDLRVFDSRASQFINNQYIKFIWHRVNKIFYFSSRDSIILKEIEGRKQKEAIKAVFNEYRPDIVIVLTGQYISVDSIKWLKSKGPIMVNWFTDSIFDPARYDLVKDIGMYYDYFFIIDHGCNLNDHRLDSCKVDILPTGCDPDIHKQVSLSRRDIKKYGSDVSFIGTLKFKRKELLASLRDFDLAIWGYWDKIDPRLRKNYRKKLVFGEEAVRIYNASKIVIDIPAFYGIREDIHNVTQRLFEVPASGGFLLTADRPLVSEFYKVGEEMVCYKDEKDLKEIIKYYLAHPEEREAMAKRAQNRARKEYTYKTRLEKMFSIIKNGRY